MSIYYNKIIIITAVVTGYLVDHVSARIVMITGSLVATIGLIICAFAPTLEYVIIGYGVLVG